MVRLRGMDWTVMSDENTPITRWQASEMIRLAIEKHEQKKETKFVTKTEFEYTNKLRDQLTNERLKDLENYNIEAKDRSKWLLRLVGGAVILSLIPIIVALLSQAQGSILR